MVSKSYLAYDVVSIFFKELFHLRRQPSEQGLQSMKNNDLVLKVIWVFIYILLQSIVEAFNQYVFQELSSFRISYGRRKYQQAILSCFLKFGSELKNNIL